MQVDEHVNSLEAAFFLLDELFEVVHFREGMLALLVVSPVQVLSEEAGAVVASNNSIRIHHRDDLKDHLLDQLFGTFFLRAEILNEPFNNM